VKGVQLFGVDLDYVAFVVLFCIGLSMVIAKSNLLKKLLGLNVMETAVFAFIVTAGMIEGGDPPVLAEGTGAPFVSPIPHAMVITGIVVALGITAVALALIIQVHAHYGTIELDELKERP
jgi:multicomponent Na+:H+ antiporter subunit C